MKFPARIAFATALLVGSLALVPAAAQNVTVVVNESRQSLLREK